MTHHDRVGYDLTTTSGAAAAAYNEAVDRLLVAQPGVTDQLEIALDLDPDFALARGTRALCRYSQAPSQSRQDLVAAAAADVTERERWHLQCLLELLTGEPGAFARARGYLDVFARDALIFDQLHARLFFFAGHGRLDQITALVDALAPKWDTDWYFAGKRALVCAEQGKHELAMELARQSIAQRPDNANAWHAECHALHGLGEHGAVETLLSERLADYDGRWRSHLSWHRALVALGEGRSELARALYEQELRPGRHRSPAHLALADTVGLLWSWKLVGEPNAPSWNELQALVDQQLKGPSRPFECVHIALALAAIGDVRGLDTLRRRLDAVPEGPSSQWKSVVEGATYLHQGAWDAAAAVLEHLDPQALDATGGSLLERMMATEAALFARRQHGASDALTARLRASRATEHPVIARILQVRA